MPIVGIRSRRVIAPATTEGNAFQDYCEGARFLHGQRVFHDGECGVHRLALHLESPEHRRAVWGVRPMWPNTGMPAFTMARDQAAMSWPPSSFTGRSPSLYRTPAFVMAWSMNVVGHERHVADDVGALDAARDRLRVV